MTISKELITSLDTLIQNYSAKGKNDNNYSQILTHLQQIKLAIIKRPKDFYDHQVISMLTNSALLLEDGEFQAQLIPFLVDYQQNTQALDLLVDDNLEIKDDLENWHETTEELEALAASKNNQTRFFRELTEAVEARKIRMKYAEELSSSLNTSSWKNS